MKATMKNLITESTKHWLGWWPMLWVLLTGLPLDSPAQTYASSQSLIASKTAQSRGMGMISLNADKRSVASILKEIEVQSGYTFLYSNDQLSTINRTLVVKARPLEEVLSDLLLPMGIGYKIAGRQIILSVPESPLPERNVSGKVRDGETGQPIPGASVAIKGTTRGVVTDAEGSFKIAIPDAGAVLIFSFVGFVTQEVEIKSQSSLEVQLLPDVKTLQEVQVVAFGEQRRRDVTGSIATLKAADIRANTAVSPDVALQGRAAGVQITQAGGTPGGAVRINVRGVASINSNAQPLIVIDGQPVINNAFGSGGIAMNPLAEINPDDIESMEVLKDASASILFGSRAANGVILITTKKGKKGKPNFDFSYQEGVNDAANRIDIIDNGADHFNILKRAAANNVRAGLAPASTNLAQLLPTGILKGTLAPTFDDRLIDSTTIYNTRTDWLSQTLRQGSFRQATFGVSAGTSKLSAYASGSYRKENGIVIGQSFQRLSGRVNVEYAPTRRIKMGINGSINSIDNETIPLGNSFQYGLTSALPAYPIRLSNDSFFNGISNGTNNTVNIGTNPLFYRENYTNLTNTLRSTNTAYLQIEPLAGLTLRSEVGYDYQRSTNDILLTPTLYPAGIIGNERGGSGRAENRDVRNQSYNVNNLITYTKEFNKKHRLTVLAGNSVQSRRSDNETYITERVPDGATRGTDTSRAVVFKDELSFRFVSFFGRVNYAFKDKYLVEASLRSDGSSRFGPGKRWATFPGASVGWILSEENFLKNSSFVNFLKMRASYGLTGNAEIGNFSWQKTFTYVGYNAAIYGGIQGGQFTNPGNSTLSWESTKQLDLGLEFVLFNNRLRGTFDYYNKDSEGLLLDYNLGPLFGTINNVMTINLGSVRNRGVELSLSTQNVVKKGFRWTTDFNVSRNKNTVLSTYTAPFLNYPTQIINGPNIATPGYPLGTYYMAQFAGFDPVTGNELFLERDRVAFANRGVTVATGNLWDGTIANQAANNQFILDGKTPYPMFFGGLTNTFQIGAVDFSFLLYYQYGNWIYDQGERIQSYPTTGQVLRANVPGIGDLRNELARGDGTGAYRLQWNSNARSFESTRFLHDGSFVRLKNVQLGYNLPAKVAKKMHLRSARVYLTGQNLLTFTKFNGWDPEVFRNGGADGSTATLSPGLTNNDLPQVKTYLLGINVGF